MQRSFFALKSRTDLAAMGYDLEVGRAYMAKHGYLTIMLVQQQDEASFHVRNAFASNGIIEDPATGAAAAFGGYLRDQAYLKKKGRITLLQGEDMGMPSTTFADIGPERGRAIKISDQVRSLD